MELYYYYYYNDIKRCVNPYTIYKYVLYICVYFLYNFAIITDSDFANSSDSEKSCARVMHVYDIIIILQVITKTIVT